MKLLGRFGRWLALAALCTGTATAGEGLEDPIPEPIERGDVYIELETIATGLTAPNWGTSAPGVPDRLYVTDQDGIAHSINLDTLETATFLDVSDRLVELGIGGPGSFDERGLLGIAFHPDYQTNGLLYTYTSEPVAGEADFSTIPDGEEANHQTMIIEWEVLDPTDADTTVDPASARELLRIDQPQFNHNAGALAFGPDGMLYIALGDGGAGDDQGMGHGDAGNGQNAMNPLGTLLRIDPLGSDSANGRYGIPADNPFTDPADDRLDEIYAYGFRNPFRFSFDRANGDLYVADVGQNDIEEVDLVESGGNYGWNLMEGSFVFNPNGDGSGFVTDEDPIPGLELPIAEYDHDEGIAIVGGFVERSGRVPPLNGIYVFGEFAVTFSNDGRLFYLNGSTIREFNLVGQDMFGMSLLGFGQDAGGEIYVLANSTGVPFGDTGVVLRIKLRDGDVNGDGAVNLSDLATLLTQFGTCDGTVGYFPALDFDRSGCVDLNDLSTLLQNYGATP